MELTILIRAVNQTTGAFSGIGLAATAALAAVGAGLAYSVKQAAAFQQELTTLVTGAGEHVNNLQMVGEGIKQISIDTATSTDDLIKSMFLIESASHRGQEGLDLLRIASEGAKVGNTDLIQTTQVLLTMLHDYHQPASQAVADTNSIIKTVQSGTMTMDDLQASLKNVLSIASTLHINLSDVEGALATMSVAGDKGSAAGTHLAMMLRMLSNPATTAANEMAAMGLNSVNLANEMRISLPLALQEIETAVAKHFVPGSVEFNRAVMVILGGTRSGTAGLELMNKNLPIFRQNANDAASAIKNAGSAVQGWSLVQQEFNFRLGQTQQALNVAATDLGTLLLPELGRVLAALTPLIGQFTLWIETSQGLHTAISNVGDFMVGTLIPAMQTSAIWVSNLVQGAIHLYQAFQQGQPWVMAVATALTSVYVAIKLIAFEEMVAGWVNWFNTMRAGNGLIANIANQALPQLGQALGWTKTQSDALSASLKATQAEALAEAASFIEAAQAQKAEADAALTSALEAADAAAGLAAAAQASAQLAVQAQVDANVQRVVDQHATEAQIMADMTEAAAQRAAIVAAEAAEEVRIVEQAAAEEVVALEAAAAAEVAASMAAAVGISLALGVATAGISLLVGAAIVGITQAAVAGKTAIQNASQQVRDTYNSLGQSADDVKAKQQAMAIEAQADATNAATYWRIGVSRIKQASADAKAQYILDQQAMADAAEKAAQRADAAWQQASQAGDIVSLLRAAGWTDVQIARYLHQRVTGVTGTVTPTGRIGGHASGISNSPFGHYANLAERGGEWMYIPSPTTGYVPQGASVFPHGTGPGGGGNTFIVNVSTMAGSRAEINRMVDLLEEEIGRRFRSQTNSFSYGGVL